MASITQIESKEPEECNEDIDDNDENVGRSELQTKVEGDRGDGDDEDQQQEERGDSAGQDNPPPR